MQFIENMLEHILNSMNICDQGLLPFNNGNIRAFLYGRKWYPLRAVFNHALLEIGENEETTDRALARLSYLLHFTRVANIQFDDNFPVEIAGEEIFDEIRTLNQIINRLL